MKKIFLIMLMILGLICGTAYGKDISLEEVKEKGYFIVGLDATFAPMGFRDENGELVGFDIDLAKEVAKRMGVEVKFKPCEWDGIIFDLRSKKIDMVWNGMSITEQRKKQVAFSETYLIDGQIIFTRKGTEPAKIKDLAGKTVGVQLGSSGALAVEKNSISSQIKEIKKYSTNVEALLDLEAGRTDAVVMDSVSGKYYNSKKDTLNSSEESLSDEHYAVAFRKNDKALIEEIDKQLINMKNDGTFKKISEKWLGRK